ncbi:MAG: diversity-generating retroelement protein Avd [bacterium]|nr:diversity-generating retroelement protein Avd [bacterium]
MGGQSPIFVKTEALMLWLLAHTRKFPREERFRLAARVEHILFTFHESLLYAAKSTEPQRYLRKADAEFDMLRTYLRFALELGYTTSDQYKYVAEEITEIGKLLGGWLKKA